MGLRKGFAWALISITLWCGFWDADWSHAARRGRGPRLRACLQGQVDLLSRGVIRPGKSMRYRPDLLVHYVESAGSPRRFEIELVRQSGLSLEEVMGLTRNFHDDLLLDGSTGVFRVGDELVVDASVNLISAYKNGMSRIRPGKLTVDDILEIRDHSMKYFTPLNKDEIIERGIQFKPKGSTAPLPEKLDPSVRAQMEAFGIEILGTPPKLVAKYPDEATMRKGLQKIVDEINRRVRSRLPEENIVAYAVQQILILHPFDGGNGRTARILGQILAKKLTGKTLILPKIFQRELEVSEVDLVEAIGTGLINDGRGWHYELWIRGLALGSLKMRDITYRSLDQVRVDPPPPSAVDSSFPESIYWPKGVKLAWKDIPDEAKTAPETVYYGVPAATLEEAESKIKLLFTYGRKTRGNPHFDIRRHVEGTQGQQVSGFMQTSKSSLVVDTFTGYRVRVVFEIDTRGAQVLDLDKLYAHHGMDLGEEQEVLFATTLNPRRIRSAVIRYERPDGTHEVVVVPNPNYRFQGDGLTAPRADD